MLLATLFLCGFLLLSLVLLSRLRETVPVAPPPVSRPTVLESPPTDTVAVKRSALERVVAEYLQSNLPGEEIQSSLGEQGELLLQVAAPAPQATWIEGLQQVLAAAAPNDPPSLEQPRAEELTLLWQGSRLARIIFAPPVYPAPSPPAPAPPAPPAVLRTPRPAGKPVPHPSLAGAPKVAIVMDDLGLDLASAKALLAIDLPVTMAILPWNGKAPQVAELAHQRGREVLIHLPMEPQGYPAINPGPEALLVSLDAGEIRRRIEGYRARVPYAVGGNNHMGSRLTEDREKMQLVVAEMRGAGLFFLDSMTSGGSVAYETARAAGVPAARRDRFLDNVQETGKIAGEIRKLIRLAKHQGFAIGICHPYPQTLAALRQEAVSFSREGVEVVPVSRLLDR